MYAQRNKAGQIFGLFANLQPGTAEEFLKDDSPEVWAFLNPTPTKEQRIGAILKQVGCFNEVHLTKDMLLMEGLGARDGLTKEQLYAANPTYRGMTDAAVLIAAIGAGQ